MTQVRICPSKIPESNVRVLCATVIDAVNQFYADPNHLREFEQWKCEKEEKAKCLKSK